MSKFSEYVTSTAFHLHLSKNQCAVLCMVAEKDSSDLYTFRLAVPVLRNLEDKGLVEHNYIPPAQAPAGHRSHTLTKEGKLVYQLLKMAGIADRLMEKAA